MAVIDSDSFITHLVWSGLIDKATCGELKEAIERCTVKDVYTKDEVIALLIKIRTRINNMYLDIDSMECIKDVIEEEINALRGEEDV